MNYKLTNEQRAQLHRILDLAIDEAESGIDIDFNVATSSGYATINRFVYPADEEMYGEFIMGSLNPAAYAYHNLTDLEMNLLTAAKLRDEVFTPVLGEVLLKDAVVA